MSRGSKGGLGADVVTLLSPWTDPNAVPTSSQLTSVSGGDRHGVPVPPCFQTSQLSLTILPLVLCVRHTDRGSGDPRTSVDQLHINKSKDTMFEPRRTTTPLSSSSVRYRRPSSVRLPPPYQDRRSRRSHSVRPQCRERKHPTVDTLTRGYTQNLVQFPGKDLSPPRLCEGSGTGTSTCCLSRVLSNLSCISFWSETSGSVVSST